VRVTNTSRVSATRPVSPREPPQPLAPVPVMTTPGCADGSSVVGDWDRCADGSPFVGGLGGLANGTSDVGGHWCCAVGQFSDRVLVVGRRCHERRGTGRGCTGHGLTGRDYVFPHRTARRIDGGRHRSRQVMIFQKPKTSATRCNVRTSPIVGTVREVRQ
jgi:hypothetical protein